MADEPANAEKLTSAPRFEVTSEMLSDFVDALSDFEVGGVAIPQRFLERVLQDLAPHLARQIARGSSCCGSQPSVGTSDPF